MIKKLVTGVCLLLAFAACARADQSPAYKQYFDQGVQAFNAHDDQKALRCFKIAEIYDPADPDLQHYLAILEKRGEVLQLPQSKVPPEGSLGYKYYLKAGIEAYERHDRKKAAYYFTLAVIFNPRSEEADHYLRMLGTRNIAAPVSQVPVTNPVYPSEGVTQPYYVPSVQAQQAAVLPQHVVTAPAPATVEMPQLPEEAQPQPVENVHTVSTPQPVVTAPVEQTPSVQPAPAPEKPTIHVGPTKPKQPPQMLSLSQITSGQIKPTLTIEFHSSVILEGRNIQRFLVVTEGFINVKIIDNDHIQVDARKIGTTFLHIWDDSGRHTLYVEVVFPKTVSAAELTANYAVQHSQAFVFTYANDYSTYYMGKNISGLKRDSYEFHQSLGVTGETPYGFFDASGSYTDFSGFSDFDSYTIGLSQIPLPGTANLNLRGFDALRYMSPLVMPSTRMRGVFADVDLMDEMLRLSVSHGQEQPPLGFVLTGQNQFANAYIDAVKLTLFPKNLNDQYSVNFATGYGPQREPYLSNHVYSAQGLHKFNDYLSLETEAANDSSHDAELASLRWEQGNFRTGLHFRNIDKNYSTVSTLPSYQGETGASWAAELDDQNLNASAFAETYRDHLDFNPDDPTALNYDANANVRAHLNPNLWTDTDFYYTDTPGELSPHRSLSLNQRVSRSFGIWKGLKATVFAGGGYQNSNSTGGGISDYDREDLLAGVQVPLNNEVSLFSNYEYDWLNQPAAGGNSHPGVLNAGVEYTKQLNAKLSVNAQAVYRDEMGVVSNESLLAGQKSVIVTSGFNYNPTPDWSIFADAQASKVTSHVGNQPYDDFEVHVGMRLTFGTGSYWDPQGTVSGIVFKDKNGDGKYERGDEGIPGIKLKVGDKEVTTDKNGRFRIKVRAKAVQVVPELDTIPGGLIFSGQQMLTVPIVQGHETHADFGLTSQTGIYGIVFVSKTGSNVPGAGDKFIGKVRIILDGKTSQRSDPHGAFYFRKVTPGEHTISVDINTLAINMVPLVKLQDKINVTEGTNYMFNVPVQVKKAQGGQD